jgi:hypothetical protein
MIMGDAILPVALQDPSDGLHFLGLLLLLVFGAGIFILIYGMQLKAKRNEQLTELYRQAISQGLDPREIQIDLDSRSAGDPQGNLKAGIILLATALGIILGILCIDKLAGGWRMLGFALVPGCIGLAALFIHFAVPRPRDPQPPAA